jgi:hypothetical protein
MIVPTEANDSRHRSDVPFLTATFALDRSSDHGECRLNPEPLSFHLNSR